MKNPVVSTDSRQVQPGSLFFALKGESFNGNEFATLALKHGASYAIVDEPKYADNDRFILVKDVLSTLQEMARHHRLQFNIPVIAITGSNGKTTSRELINSVLSKKYRTLATKGNLNNHIGVPLTLLSINAETDLAIIEMGANHPGEIDFLCRIAYPNFGLITNIGKAHLEGFGSFEGVIRTKTELSNFLKDRDGIMFLNNGDELLKIHVECPNIFTYGPPPADVALLNVVSDPFVKMGIGFSDKSLIFIESNLYGSYNAGNILSAACIGQQFSISPEEIKTAIEEYHPGNNRSQILKTDHNLLILDAYNANPSSMEAALTMFAETTYIKKMVILGDMLELGNEADHEHRKILGLLDHLKFQQVFLVGNIFTRLNTNRENICFHDTDLARMWLEHHKIENSTILVKGSRGIKLEKLVESL
ncbi:MAG: UDP-N-acetylmuramoyl-tripeptide--D-alanyl-D-alanine ligase [Bacteroidota bacterium]